MLKLRAAFVLALFYFCSCSSQQKADLLLYNARIYLVDSVFNTAEAMVIKDGRIEATGTASELEKIYDVKEKIDANGKFVYPGFIDAHAHFVGYGNSLQTADLVGSQSWEEVLQHLQKFEQTLQPGEWLTGRGWDQNDWPEKKFPGNEKLDELFPERPVLLTRIDGHAAIANTAALRQAGIRPGQKISGGEIEAKDGRLTGILIDNAIGLVSRKIPAQGRQRLENALLDAQKNCFAAGLTTIDDCGLDANMVELLREMQKRGDLKIRLYVMLSDDEKNFDYLEKNGIIKTDRIHVRSFKVYGDGALGSRGACLIEPYSDRPDSHGFLLSSPQHFDSVAARIAMRGFQMCTHAIGDSGNRTILRTYARHLKGANDFRWRIEHAQVVHPDDFKEFGKFSIIPSVQPTHATSDMYWAAERLGKERVKGAYAFKQLLEQNGWMPLGTDFPVEDISPFKTFYAAVARKDANNWPETGFQKENALDRKQTLRGMTIWAARSNFEEKEKGSLEKGKFADFIILDRDIMEVSEEEVLQTRVLKTFLAGEMVYENKNR